MEVNRTPQGSPNGRESLLRLGGHTFGPTELVVMAIVNRTPDSFYDRGATFAEDAALRAVEAAVENGARIVDIGGVKAGPGAVVDADEEIRRTVPTVAAVRSRFPDVVISIDTWRAEVAREAGADLINDTWAGADPGLAEVAAATGAGLVCSHAGGLNPRSRPHRASFDDVVADVVDTVTRLARRAVEAGVRPDGILVDPAHDFGKTTRHSLELLRRTDALVATGWPVLMALSNKDFVGETLDVPLEGRLTGTLAATAIAAWLGARVFRAHEVRQTREVLELVSAVRGDRQPAVVRRGLA
jgi:dihydropteroate synthase